jgi:aminoglycoside phosphotransferase (APT) family kinase protein
VNDTETTEVRGGHEIDIARLSDYLALKLPGFVPPLIVRQFKGGQSNPTYLLTVGGRRYVLRKKPTGALLPGAHMIEREYRVISALKGSGVPVPAVPLLCEDPGIVGTSFYLMEFIDGRVFRDPALPGMPPAERAAIYQAMAVTMAHLHQVDWRQAGLEGFGKPTGYLERQIALWTRQYLAGRTHEIPAMENLAAWLPANLPRDARTTISHGDFRLENLIFAPDRPEVLATLDWELATLGHPFADLAYNCMIWHLPADAPVPGLAGLDLAALGIPSEADYIAGYCAAAGIDRVPDYAFYLAFSFFRFAAIAQGIYARFLGGNASAPNAEQVGLLAAPLAELGWEAAGRTRRP